MSISLSVCSSGSWDCWMRLSGCCTRHLFARCYCLHCGHFLTCCDNFIKRVEINPSHQNEHRRRDRDLKGCKVNKEKCEGITENKWLSLFHFHELSLDRATSYHCCCSETHPDATRNCCCRSLDLPARQPIFPSASPWIQMFIFRDVRRYQTSSISGMHCAVSVSGSAWGGEGLQQRPAATCLMWFQRRHKTWGDRAPWSR